MARYYIQHMLDKGAIGFWGLWQDIAVNTH